jgi:tRNA threonylcarbamoyladenosine biosynthesis protein TsaE
MELEGHFKSNSVEDTLALARRFGAERGGGLVLLYGGLGAGKTLFARGYAEGLGISAHVSSPSYTLMNEYFSADMAMYHLDLYRLNCLEEVVDIGLFDILELGHSCLVEWPERVAELASLPHLEVRLVVPEGGNSEARDISWVFKG